MDIASNSPFDVTSSQRGDRRRQVIAEIAALNRKLMVAVQTGGNAYVSNAMIGDAFALRACIVNIRTTEGDLAQLLEDIRSKAAAFS